MKRTLLAAAVLSALLVPFAPSQNAAAIIKKHEEAKVADLEKYLAESPGAEDAESAEQMLLDAYSMLGEDEKALPLLRKAYAATSADNIQQKAGLGQAVVELAAKLEGKEAAVAFVERVKKDFAKHPAAAQIAQHFDGMVAKPMIGETLELAFKDTAGNDFDLSKMEGKVVLVDFWATWCGPCVREMPNVLAAYEKYHDKGFEIVGISLDQDKAAMDKFIADRKMTWPQHFDGKGWENELAKKHGIGSIPATFLVKDGKVVAADLRGPALAEAIEKHLDE